MKATTLNEVQCVYVRQLLFEELHDSAEILAEQAIDAARGGNAGSENVNGDDALSTLRNRVMPIVDVLGTIGWSVETDTVTIVQLERKRRVA
jgi:hypothetical protein